MYFYLKEIINRFLISVSCFVKLYLKPRIPALTNNECPPGKKSGYMDCCKKNTITTHCPFIIFLWLWILLSISHFPELDEFKSQGKSSKISLKSRGKGKEKYLQKAVGTLYDMVNKYWVSYCWVSISDDKENCFLYWNL